MKRIIGRGKLRLGIRKGRRGPQLYTPREKLYNCIWEFTKGDPDDHPSVPHAHARGLGYRLNAWTGEIYPAGNDRTTVIGHLKKKELSRLYNDQKFIDFATDHILWYREAHPSISFFVPEWFELKHLSKKKVAFKKGEDDQGVFVFISESYINDNLV